ncbi:hypothetical protein BD626DRAFT_570730 [Schizophyllum amplum]|uniref:Uncharacterized protein n=1 Tax=Schizophyllum amplum TaxID=97359 RepID=A0A550C9P3_9AGAR|nr:hypothetical protein BD626DRAFT_570730 [Auriculariopsis ampla]
MTSGAPYVSYDAYGQAWLYSADSDCGLGLILPDAANFPSNSSYQSDLRSPDSLASSPMIMTPDGATSYPSNAQYPNAWMPDMCGAETAAAASFCSCPACVALAEPGALSTCATDPIAPDVALLYAGALVCSDGVVPSYAQDPSTSASVYGSSALGTSAWTTPYSCYSDSGSCGGVGISTADTFSHQLPVWPGGLGASDLAGSEPAQGQATEDQYMLCPADTVEFDPYDGFEPPAGPGSEEEEKYRRASQVIHPRPRRNIPIVSLDKLAASAEPQAPESPLISRPTDVVSRPSLERTTLPRWAPLPETDVYYPSCSSVGLPYSQHHCS